MGGTDEPENLVELTPAEHAEAHRVLYEEHGREEDRLAWMGLAGYTKKETIIQELITVAAKKGGAANRENMIKNNPMHNPETVIQVKDSWKTGPYYEADCERLRNMASNMKGRKFPPRSAEHCANLSKAKMGNIPGNKGKKCVIDPETGRRSYV